MFVFELTEDAEDAKGTTVQFRFARHQFEEMSRLLQDASSIRRIEVRYEGATYTRNEFLRALWEEKANREQAERRRAFEEAGRSWPLPDKEFRSLVQNAGLDAEFDEPMDPKERQELLDIVVGAGFQEPAWVHRVFDVIRRHSTVEYDSVKRAVEGEYNIRAWNIEQEIRWAIALHAGARSLASAREATGIVWMMTCPDVCRACVRLYREPDGRTPRLFYAAELPQPGFNAGRDLPHWLPTAPLVHLGCGCIPASWLGPHFLPEISGLPRRYFPVVTRLPSWRQERL